MLVQEQALVFGILHEHETFRVGKPTLEFYEHYDTIMVVNVLLM